MLEGATVVVRRGDEYLVLHRAIHDHDGDWAWGPTGGLRDDGETYEQTAGRKLFEETGLGLPLDDACARCLPDVVAVGIRAAS